MYADSLSGAAATQPHPGDLRWPLRRVAVLAAGYTGLVWWALIGLGRFALW